LTTRGERRPRGVTMRNWLIRLIARVPASVHTKLLAAFLTMVVLLMAVGATGLTVLSSAHDRAEELVKLQMRSSIGAARANPGERYWCGPDTPRACVRMP
jgi:hypothetical protein